MGLFEKAGRRFEQFKQKAADTAEESAGYECSACGKRLYTAQDQCPECGADAVVPVDRPDEGAVDEETTDEGAVDEGPTGREAPDDETGDGETTDDEAPDDRE